MDDEELRARVASERAAQVIDAYRQAFAPFSYEEMRLLDGIILEAARDR